MYFDSPKGIRPNDSELPTPLRRRPLRRINGSFSPGHLNKIPSCLTYKEKDWIPESKRTFQQSPSCYLSPHRLSKFRKKHRNDLSELRLLPDHSFEANQSFPRVRTSFRTKKMDNPEFSIPKPKQTIECVRVDGPNGVRFNSCLGSLSESPLAIGAALHVDKISQGINPNKAVFTIDSNTTQILIVNSGACALLGYSCAELCALRLSQLLKARPPPAPSPALSLQDTSLNTSLSMSGKVVEMVTGSGGVVVVSLWIRQLEHDGPLLAVAEPVHIKQAILFVDGDTGVTTGCDSEDAALIFQCDNTDRLLGLNISTLIPSISMPSKDSPDIIKQIYKQKATGRTFDGSTFPLCLWIRHHEPTEIGRSFSLSEKENTHCSKRMYDITIRVYHNVSGLLVVDESGLVSACNHHFTILTFGKSRQDIIGRPITSIIPDFCSEARLVHAPQARSRNHSISPVNNHDSDSDTDPIDDVVSRKSPISVSIPPSQVSQITRDKSSSALCLDKSSSCHNLDKTHTPTPTQDMVSSISTTEQRLDATDHSLIPDVISGVSNMSMDEEYFNSSISKSRSENILASAENRENNLNLANKHNDPTKSSTDRSDSIYFTSRKSVDYSVNSMRATKDTSLRHSCDASKYLTKTSMKPGVSLLEKSNMSLDLCDSNETSADFLTPINEMPMSASGDGFVDDSDLLSEKSLVIKSGMLRSEARNSDSNSESPNKFADREWLVGTPRAPRFLPSAATSTPRAGRSAGGGGGGAAPNRPLHPLHHQPHQTCATYRGHVLHRDGTELAVIYTVSGVSLRGGGNVLCVWIGVSGPEPFSLHPSSFNSTADNSISIVHKQGSHNVSRPLSVSLLSQCGEEQTSGDYSKNYVTLKQIGKGAYGCVKMAYRRSDRLLVIAKFILKEKVNQQLWVLGQDKSGRKVPLEVSLLQTLKHPNIVTVIDVYENDKYFQMIMEKHGSGMDLFEFIERWPKMEEPLTSYIFRQIGQAVEYLHSLSILHRDIKDENVIIDNKFHVKLIDFGSATFRRDGVLFSTFYGTTEYCSPEVLAGNKYAGPQLEMWSMGVTLYILVFYENPFIDIEDTIQALLVLPQPITDELEHLLRWMLCKSPEERCTVAQLMKHPWICQPVNINNYNFSDIIDCEAQESLPEVYYSGWGRSGSPLSAEEEDVASLTSRSSHTDPHNLPLDVRTGTAIPQEATTSHVPRRSSRDKIKRRSQCTGTTMSHDKEGHSDNYSLRSSCEILDISKPMSDAGITDLSSDATGRSACEFECDDQYNCDSWDECDPESLS